MIAHFIKASKQELPVRNSASRMGVTVFFHIFDLSKSLYRAIVL